MQAYCEDESIFLLGMPLRSEFHALIVFHCARKVNPPHAALENNVRLWYDRITTSRKAGERYAHRF